MISISNNPEKFFLVKTSTNTAFVVEVSCDGLEVFSEMCRAIVDIEHHGHVVSAVYQFSEDGSVNRVSYRSSKAYRLAKRQTPSANNN